MEEDDRPRQAAPKPPQLDSWSVAELEAHIAALEAEIARTRTAIAAKRGFRGAAEGVFKL